MPLLRRDEANRHRSGAVAIDGIACRTGAAADHVDDGGRDVTGRIGSGITIWIQKKLQETDEVNGISADAVGVKNGNRNQSVAHQHVLIGRENTCRYEGVSGARQKFKRTRCKSGEIKCVPRA